MTLRILYLGQTHAGATALHRANALERLGHSVEVIDPQSFLLGRQALVPVRHRLGYRTSRRRVRRALEQHLEGRSYDVAWVGGGRELDARAVAVLRQKCGRVLCYVNDDPFGVHARPLWDTFLDALPEYHLIAVVRHPNVLEARSSGSRRTMRIWMTFDEEVHRPEPMAPEAKERRGRRSSSSAHGCQDETM